MCVCLNQPRKQDYPVEVTKRRNISLLGIVFRGGVPMCTVCQPRH